MLIDFQKELDMINHDTLLRKLSIIGFSDDTIKWFPSFLSNRKFSVNLENPFSGISSITCSVAQELILVPLQFFIYVNYLPIVVKCNFFFLNVDNPCLVFQNFTARNIEKQLNQDFFDKKTTEKKY